MNTKPPTNSEAYLKAAMDWETDEILRARKAEHRAWLVAGFAILLAILAVIAVVLLTPLKTVEPFVVRVDKNTGVTDIVTRLDEHTVTFNEAIDKYFLAQYVRYCESYSSDTIYADYQACSALSTPELAKAELNRILPSNPRSPTKMFGDRVRVEVTINSISFLSDGVAQVRYTRQIFTGVGEEDTQWIATIDYKYLNPTEDERTRLINPVGFTTEQYRTDPVVVPTADASAPAAAPAVTTPAPIAPGTPAVSAPPVVPAVQSTGGAQ